MLPGREVSLDDFHASSSDITCGQPRFCAGWPTGRFSGVVEWRLELDRENHVAPGERVRLLIAKLSIWKIFRVKRLPQNMVGCVVSRFSHVNISKYN